MKRALVLLLAAAAGGTCWFAASYYDGQPEAWDGASYSQVFLPGLAVALVGLGFWLRERVGVLGIAASLGQMVGLMVTRGPDPAWPLDIGIFCLLVLPLAVAATVGSMLGGVYGGVVSLGRRTVRRCRRGKAKVTDSQSDQGLCESAAHGSLR